jgi:hypothetical protein
LKPLLVVDPQFWSFPSLQLRDFLQGAPEPCCTKVSVIPFHPALVVVVL